MLLAIPLFIVAANFMNAGTISDRLTAFCVALVGRFKGGLGHVNVVTSMIFAGMSGSAVADAVGLGKVSIDMMTKGNRYTPGYSAAITAATAVIGPIIPPSIPMVLYALVSDTSIGYLFLGGVVPGLFMSFAMMGLNTYMAHKMNTPLEEPVPLRDIPKLTLPRVPRADDAGDPARRHLRRRCNANRSRSNCCRLRFHRRGSLLSALCHSRASAASWPKARARRRPSDSSSARH